LPSAQFDAENLDYIWFAYRDGNLMLIEEKKYGAKQTPAQRDTHGIIHQALKFACARRNFERLYPGRTKSIRYHGYHIITFENTNPQDGKIWWDKEEIDEEELVRKLRFGA
jgi:hypothetical protein